MLFSQRLESGRVESLKYVLFEFFDVKIVEVLDWKGGRSKGSTHDDHAMLRGGLQWDVSLAPSQSLRRTGWRISCCLLSVPSSEKLKYSMIQTVDHICRQILKPFKLFTSRNRIVWRRWGRGLIGSSCLEKYSILSNQNPRRKNITCWAASLADGNNKQSAPMQSFIIMPTVKVTVYLEASGPFPTA